ncbi:hypothetical protein [Kocuria sp. TGY1127_2]|nr:hypothetical protein [Kocuria sp. TGY1127_2]
MSRYCKLVRPSKDGGENKGKDCVHATIKGPRHEQFRKNSV